MSIKSEGEELDSFLAELQIGEIKEIAGLESGFPNLSRCLNGFLPGLYLLIGPPSCGKTAFAKQLCDQVALQNSARVIFFTFAERKKDLRIRTLARLTGLESREIRKGSAFLLHWYGAPKGRITDPEQMPPSWERLKKTADAAKGWLDLIYLFEGDEKTSFEETENCIRDVKEVKGDRQIMAVIDDSQRLGASDCPIDTRLPFVAEQLQAMALKVEVPILATWPDLREDGDSSLSPYEWAERVASAEMIMVMENDLERTKKLTEPNRAVTLHIVKNRGGERGRLSFDFFPAFSKFTEAAPDSVP